MSGKPRTERAVSSPSKGELSPAASTATRMLRRMDLAKGRGGYPSSLERYAVSVVLAERAELLAALLDARAQLEQYERDLTGEAYNDLEINAAILKATGGPS